MINLKVLGHACLLVEIGNKKILFDPWITGSVYWRSWWNYPPLNYDEIEKIKPDYIILTHLHWDHFHGPSLRKLGLDIPLIIPRTPELRLKKDLEDIGVKNIIEIPHGSNFKISNILNLYCYQFHPLTDSVWVVNSGDFNLLNSNDCKIMGSPLKQILKKHKKFNFAFRSHSSANSRLCYQIIDEKNKHIDDLEKYSKEFITFAENVNTEFAIPFASNQCYLHKETVKFNKTVNFSRNVKKYSIDNNIKSVNIEEMVPGDSWSSDDGFRKVNKDWYSNIEEEINHYQNSVQSSLDSQESLEENFHLNEKIIKRFIERFKKVPAFLRLFLRKKKVIFSLTGCDKSNQSMIKNVEFDFFKCKFKTVSDAVLNNTSINLIIPAYVFFSCVKNENFNSLGISKRVVYKCSRKDVKVVQLIDLYLNFLDYRIFPLNKYIRLRSIGEWIRRWRELYFYIIYFINHKILRREFNYKDYIEF